MRLKKNWIMAPADAHRIGHRRLESIQESVSIVG